MLWGEAKDYNIKHTTGSKKGEANLYKILQHVVSVIYRYHESA